MNDYSAALNPQKALIWRIVHRDNIPWLIDNGLHCGSSKIKAPNWVDIGNPELIEKRSSHAVPIGMGGCLNDYVPFYFTPFSPMLKNIHSGWGGIKKRPNNEIVIVVSSLYRLQEFGLPFVFTNCHAYYRWAEFFTDLNDLEKIDWKILQRRDFKRDLDDPAKFERYQAEALIHKHCPIQVLEGMVCYTEVVQKQLNTWLNERNMSMPVHIRPRWYF